MTQKVLKVQCSDSSGLIAKITQICFQHGYNITRNNEYVDRDAGRFFMRTELVGDNCDEQFLQELAEVLPQGAEITLHPEGKRPVVLLATKEAHCLGGILLKCYEDALNIEIKAVVANYPDLQGLVESFGIQFHCVSHEGLSRVEHDRAMMAVIDQYQPEILGLAKYMRILSPDFVSHYAGRVVNIHHSFLPAFIGAKPYLQAYNRGVKMIGATCHFVTNDLDEGPIIWQDITKVTHADNALTMAKKGRDVEKFVFAKGLELVAEHKVFINAHRTVVFE